MKCQQCEKLATFHITELTGKKPVELHLCEQCAKKYLSHPDPDDTSADPDWTAALAQKLVSGEPPEELNRLDQKCCPVCGLSFYEFRHQGRLGCPHDYIFFGTELEPLLVNVHGETKHVGKRPKAIEGGTEEFTQLIRLRREMKVAVEEEHYERARELRDEIRRIESKHPSG